MGGQRDLGEVFHDQVGASDPQLVGMPGPVDAYNQTEPPAPARCNAGQCVLGNDGPVRYYLEVA